METISLEVQSRQEGLKARSLRRQGLIPAVFYGSDEKNKDLQMDYQTFRRAYLKAGGNTVIALAIDGQEKTNVLVHDIQYDPVTDAFTHVDFIHVNLNKEVTAEIPLVFIGTAPAVKDLGGTLMENRTVLEVRCLAKDLPKTLEVDVSGLEDFNTSVHIGDIKLPEGVEAVDDEGLTIATVAPPRAEEEEAPAEAAEGELAEGAEGGEAPAEGDKKEGAAEEGEKGE